jgi:hypothetical protein
MSKKNENEVQTMVNANAIKAEEVKIEEVKIEEVTADKIPLKADKVKADKLQLLIKKLPDSVTPKNLDELFQFNDGGKTVRRHLRKKFSDNHEHKADWKWSRTDKVLAEIVKYFADRYEIPTKKAEAK